MTIGAKKIISEVKDKHTIVADTFCDRPRLEAAVYKHVPSWRRPGSVRDGWAMASVILNQNGSVSLCLTESAELHTGRETAKETMMTLPEPATRELYRMLKAHYDAQAAAVKEAQIIKHAPHCKCSVCRSKRQ